MQTKKAGPAKNSQIPPRNWGCKGSNPSYTPRISFYFNLKIGRKKTRKPLKFLGFSVRYLFWSHNMAQKEGFELLAANPLYFFWC